MTRMGMRLKTPSGLQVKRAKNDIAGVSVADPVQGASELESIELEEKAHQVRCEKSEDGKQYNE